MSITVDQKTFAYYIPLPFPWSLGSLLAQKWHYRYSATMGYLHSALSSLSFITALWLQSRKCLQHHKGTNVWSGYGNCICMCVCVCVCARARVYNRLVYKYGCAVSCCIGAQGLARGSSKALPVTNYGAFRWTSSQTAPHYNSGSCITEFSCSISLQRRQHPVAAGRSG